jgi:ribonucleoside-diphosphate reductase alpha subunit
MAEHLYVIKRDGTQEPVSFDQILQRIRKLSDGLDHVNPDLVAQKVCMQLSDGIKTSELDEFAAETCAMMQSRYHPNYGMLAARILIDNHHKNTPGALLDCVEVLHHEQEITSEEYHDLVCKHKNEYQKMIDYSRDFMFDYFGFKTLERAYLLKKDGKVVERPQHLWMRVAIQLHGNDFHHVKETYDALSQGYFIHATPTLYNSGTNHPQLSSCFLLKMDDDSIKGIYKTLGDCAQISKWAGGIGLAVHDIRARGSRINGTNGESTGLVPMLKVFNDTAKYVNQGGKRNGSFAIYLEPWHADIEEFLRLKLNQGAEEDRARDLFYGLWIPDLFMKRVENDELWTLMCPHECPGLQDCHSEKFDELYLSYENSGKGRKRILATKLWQMILDAQIQTGTPYLCYKDAANRKSNQQHLGTIKSSNLCTEIMEFTSPEESAVCNLGSLALTKFVEDGAFNFEKLRKFTSILTRNLDIVIDKNFYPTPECRKSNMKHRPIGIGIQGLADVFAKLRLPWTSSSAKDLNREIFENIYFAAMEASMYRTCEKGVAVYNNSSHSVEGEYPSYYGSPLSQGRFQFDLWKQWPTHTSYLDWNKLKNMVGEYGARNSLLVAPMPTASTSQILGNNECFEPFTSNLYTRRVLAGDFMVVNKHLVDELTKLGLWTSEVRTQIIAENGSVQGILAIPQEIRDIYKTVWEIPQKVLIDMSADRAPFICQSQSLNLFLSEPTYAKISSMHMYAWKKGLKTGCYYLRTKAASSAQKFTVEPPASNNCLTCSS